MITKSIEQVLFLFNDNLHIELELLGRAFLDILSMPEIKERDIFLASFLSFLMYRQNKDEIKECISIIIKFEQITFVPHHLKQKVMGLCGSGKKGIKTINISTPSAIIASSCGVNIIKPGSQSTSSRTGSADFFTILGVKNIPNITIEDMLKEFSFAFISIENTLAKFDSVYGHRFYVPTVLGFALAAISIPIICDKIVYGLSHSQQKLSYDLLKEICLTDPTILSTKVKNGIFVDEAAYGEILITNNKGQSSINPQDFINNWSSYSINDFQEKMTSEENVLTAIRAIKGKGVKPIQDLYALNSAIYLKEMDIVSSLKEGFRISLDAIQSGHAYDHLRKIVKLFGGNLIEIERT